MIERKTLAFELKGVSSDGSEFEGIAAGFNNIDSYGDIIAPGAFSDTLPQFLENGFIGGLNHNWDSPIGKPLDAKEIDRGLWLKARVSATAHGDECKTLIKDGVVRKLSIGFRTKGREWLDTAEDVVAYWQGAGYQPTANDIAEAAYGARLLTKLHLYETSPVTVPANGACDITDTSRLKSADAPDGRSFEDHSERTLAAVEEWLERVKSLADLRKQDGRALSRLGQKRLQRMAEMLKSMDDLLKRAPGVTPEQLRRAYIEEAAAIERLIGV